MATLRPASHLPTISKFNPSLLSLNSVHQNLSSEPIPTRDEVLQHSGPGISMYVPKPTKAQIGNNSLFASAYRPYYYPDPERKMFIDADGRECGERWIYVDPRGGEENSGKGGKGCTIS